MMAKYIVLLLAAVAQINASGCGCGLSSIDLPGSGSNSLSSPLVLLSSGNCGSSLGGSPSSGVDTRNVIAKGKYPVALRNCGPNTDQQIPVTTSRLTAPLQEKPTVRLPSCIPAPKTVSHSCTCYKTIMRPRVHQQIITVPSIQRYLETSHKPVVENIQYEALPVNCGSGASSGSGLQLVQVSSGFTSPVELVTLGSGSSCGSQVQALEFPTVQVPQVQAVEVPRVQIPQALGSCSCQY